MLYWCISLTIHAENQISSESSTVELIKQLISSAITILVFVLIVVLTGLYIYIMYYKQSPVQPDKGQGKDVFGTVIPTV